MLKGKSTSSYENVMTVILKQIYPEFLIKNLGSRNLVIGAPSRFKIFFSIEYLNLFEAVDLE